MATGELLRPGVEVIQTFRTASPSFVRPTLAPCVVGPAFEVVNVLSLDGTLNAKAKYGPYLQLGKAITESSFPDPRGNIDELDVLEESIRSFMLFGGTLSELFLNQGSSFLAPAHIASAAAIQTVAFGAGLDLKGKVLVLQLDNAVRTDTSKDVTVVFVGTGADAQGALVAADAAAQINDAVGLDVASVVGTGASAKVQVTSPTFGALSSVTVRAGGSANGTLQIGYSGTSSAHEERVTGSGFRGQDDKTADTLTPWIEFYPGEYILDGTVTASWGHAGRVPLKADGTTGTFVSSPAADFTFAGSNPSVPLKVGDYFFADGVRLKSGEVTKVEAGRFKVGTINTSLSVADASGQYVSKVYDTQQVGTPFDTQPFGPQYAYFRANGLDWRKAAAAPAKLTGTATAFTDAVQAVVTTVGMGTGPFDLTGKTLHYVVTVDGVDTEGIFTFVAQAANPAAVAAAIGSNIPGVVAGVVGGQLELKTSAFGRLQALTVKADGIANADLGFSTDATAESSAVGADVLYSGIAGKLLEVHFDNNPHAYQVTAPSDSLDQLVDEVNAVVGAPVASKDATGTLLVLASPLAGVAGAIEVKTGDVATALGLGTSVVYGAGRPFPDVYLDDAKVLHLGAEILRDSVTGAPLDQTSNTGTLYIQYKALRKDVSPSAKVAGVIKLSDVDTLSKVLDPLTEENPLGLGMFLAMINAPTYEVKGLGVDEVTPAAPEGTGAAWARAAGLLEAEEIYAIAPLTQDEVIHGLWRTHCSVMSSPEQGGERIVFVNKKMPTRKNPTVVVSGTQASKPTANDNQMLLDTNPSQALVALNINPVGTIPASVGLYLEFEVEGQVRRYNVQTVSGSLLTFRTTFVGSENVDGFYSDVILNVPVVGVSYGMKVRGAPLAIPGSNPVRYDYQTMAETVAEANASNKSRRFYSVFPDTVKTVVQGLEKALPGYYASACIAGMVASQPPQQGFTNFPITGLTGVSGTEKFSKRQLNIMAGGGTYVLMQEVQGGAVFSRHQVSTDLTSIETRELSITKVVDFTAKILRQGVRRFIGTNNVNKNLLDTLGTTVHAMLQFLQDAGVLNGSNLNNIAQDKAQPDTVLIDVTLDVPFPCNYIRLTLVV